MIFLSLLRSCLSTSMRVFGDWVHDTCAKPRRGFVRLDLERLEDRTVPSAQILGFIDTSGDWMTGTLSGGQLQVALAAHWDPYNLTGLVSGDFNADGEIE